MRVSIRTRQVLGVTVIVAVAVLALTGWYLISLVNLLFVESQARADLIANTIYQRTAAIVATGEDPVTALAADGGLRAILEGSVFARNISYAAVVDAEGRIVAHTDVSLVGQRLAPALSLDDVMRSGPIARARTLYAEDVPTLEVRQDLLISGRPFGSIRVGLPTPLVRARFEESLRAPVITAIAALAAAVVVSLVLTRMVVRPIHVIGSRLARLGRGEFESLEGLPEDQDFGGLDESLRAIADRLAAGPTGAADQAAAAAAVESTLSYSRKLAALSRLTAGIAHEIKNPLNAVMIHLELLRMQLEDKPESAEHLAVITAQLRRLDEVLQGFLKFTRPEDLKLQPVALAGLFETLRPVLEAEAGKTGVDVRIECPPDLPPVAADRNMLEQAVLNLGLNACQAMPNGGRLRIAARELPSRRIEMVVEDTGVGIAPEHLSRIFDLYFTTREKGSGIGLSLVYRTIQLHDGEIEVQSTPGRGTTFRILLGKADVPSTVLPIAAS
jgi:signal transduction histidine kinase